MSNKKVRKKYFCYLYMVQRKTSYQYDRTMVPAGTKYLLCHICAHESYYYSTQVLVILVQYTVYIQCTVYTRSHVYTYRGSSSIMLASDGGHADVVELLLSKGTNIHDKDSDGSSSIMLASSQGHVDVVELLLSKGASIHDKDKRGDSSIMLAFFSGHVDAVELLLSKGANIHDKTRGGSSLIMLVLDISSFSRKKSS